MKTQAEVLQKIDELRAMIAAYGADEWADWRAPLRDMTVLLGYLETRVRARWPPATPDPFQDERIGLYAIRNLNELDEARLANKICLLDYALKHPDC